MTIICLKRTSWHSNQEWHSIGADAVFKFTYIQQGWWNGGAMATKVSQNQDSGGLTKTHISQGILVLAPQTFEPYATPIL